MVKLLIVSDSYRPRWDGVARFLSEIVPRLQQLYELTLIVPDFPGDIPSHEFTVHRIGLSKFSIDDFPVAHYAKKVVQNEVEKADIVWIHGLSVLGSLAVRAAKKYAKPLIAFNHVIEWELIRNAVPGPDLYRDLLATITKVYTRWMYNKCDILMFPSTDLMATFELQGIRSPKVCVPLGIDGEKFKPPLDKQKAKLHLDLPPDSFVIGFVGRIGREKDIPTLHRAFNYIHKINPKARLLIVGKGLSEPLENMDRPSIILAGEQNDVIPFYQAMDVFVLPSLTETTSLVTLEAMACGLPVVTTPLDCLQNFIVSGENGLFFPKRNSLVLRKKLVQLMDSKTMREELGFEARYSVKQRFSWENTLSNLKEVIEQFQ